MEEMIGKNEEFDKFLKEQGKVVMYGTGQALEEQMTNSTYKYDKFNRDIIDKVLEEMNNTEVNKDYKKWEDWYNMQTPEVRKSMDEALKDQISKQYPDKTLTDLVKEVVESTKDNKELSNAPEFVEQYQKYVEEKYPDYKDNQEKIAKLQIGPLEQGETIEERRINNLQKVGVNPYKPHNIIIFSGVKTHKSVWRAMRRGHLSVNGDAFPKKPFNNRANKSSRKGVHSKGLNKAKMNIYGEYRKVAERGL